MPAVSVVMPVHNAERHVGAAVESILAQTFQDFELIVVDDASTDRSLDVVRSYRDSRIKIILLDRKVGVAAALNAGLAAATSELIARQDADDSSEPTRFERQIGRMRSRADLALIGSRAIAITSNGTVAGTVWRPIEENSIRWYALFDNPFIHSSVIFRKTAIQAQGGYRVRPQPFPEDWDLWCRVIQRYPVENLASSLVRYRVTDVSVMGAVGGRNPAEDHRLRWESAVKEIIQQHVQRFEELVTHKDTELMPSFLFGIDVHRLGAFLRSFERLLAAFCARYPNALASSDFRETLARQYDAMAMRVMPAARRVAAAIYAHALRTHPEIALQLSWGRAIALVALGHSGRARVAAWRQAW